MRSISDELCNWASHALRLWVLHARSGEHMDLHELDAIADRIDNETVELPRDRDGVPIHVGDTVYLDDGRKAEVTRIELSHGGHDIAFSACGNYFSAIAPENFTHAPRQLGAHRRRAVGVVRRRRRGRRRVREAARPRRPHPQVGSKGEHAVSEVTKIHTVDGSTVTVDGNFIVQLSEMPSISNLQGFNNKTLVNLNNVTYMEVVSSDDAD